MLSVSNGDDDANSPMILSEIHPNIFLAVLEYIYTNCCSLSTNMVSNIAGHVTTIPAVYLTGDRRSSSCYRIWTGRFGQGNVHVHVFRCT